jgi:hypothetical protein
MQPTNPAADSKAARISRLDRECPEVRAQNREGCWTDSFRVQESLGSAQRAVLKVNASVRKLLSTIKAHLVSPARNREWTAHVAMPAAKEPLEDGLYSKFHDLFPWQFVLHFRALSYMRTLARWFREHSSSVDQVAPSEWSMRASPTVSAVGSMTIL